MEELFADMTERFAVGLEEELAKWKLRMRIREEKKSGRDGQMVQL